ncbi:MAG: hypothetical protein IJU35_03415 [Paludibacteraceae bacterium]|nr:hypothetical protein [Paludibacteraceae bacterium]
MLQEIITYIIIAAVGGYVAWRVIRNLLGISKPADDAQCAACQLKDECNKKHCKNSGNCCCK